MNRRQFVLGLAASTMALVGTAHAKTGRVEKLIVLKGTGKGKARYRVDPNNKRSFSVEVEKLKALSGQSLSVSVVSNGNTQSVGSISVSTLGKGKIEVKTELGQNVPAIVAGDRVVVMQGEATLLTGTF